MTSRTRPTWSPFGSKTTTPARRATKTLDVGPLMCGGYRRTTRAQYAWAADALSSWAADALSSQGADVLNAQGADAPNAQGADAPSAWSQTPSG
jgi:hypothetical protein